MLPTPPILPKISTCTSAIEFRKQNYIDQCSITLNACDNNTNPCFDQIISNKNNKYSYDAIIKYILGEQAKDSTCILKNEVQPQQPQRVQQSSRYILWPHSRTPIMVQQVDQMKEKISSLRPQNKDQLISQLNIILAINNNRVPRTPDKKYDMTNENYLDKFYEILNVTTDGSYDSPNITNIKDALVYIRRVFNDFDCIVEFLDCNTDLAIQVINTMEDDNKALEIALLQKVIANQATDPYVQTARTIIMGVTGTSGGAILYTKYNGKRYKVRTGKRGAQYIIVNSQKKYLSKIKTKK